VAQSSLYAAQQLDGDGVGGGVGLGVGFGVGGAVQSALVMGESLKSSSPLPVRFRHFSVAPAGHGHEKELVIGW
jgi:hypothetical protein